MTQKELHNQRLLKEANNTALRFHTRRHFLRESAMGISQKTSLRYSQCNHSD